MPSEPPRGTMSPDQIAGCIQAGRWSPGWHCPQYPRIHMFSIFGSISLQPSGFSLLIPWAEGLEESEVYGVR